MGKTNQGARSPLWTFEARSPVQCVAMSAVAGWTAVADADRTAHVLDETGSSHGRFRGGQAIRRVRCHDGGELFAALAGQAIIYAFNRNADLEWRVELGGPVSDFDMTLSGDCVAGISLEGWLHLYLPSTRNRVVVPVGWPMTSVAVGGGEDARIAVCGPDGHVAVLGADGKPQWSKELEAKTGSVSLSVPADLLAVAAGDKGVLLFHLNGTEGETVNVGEPVLRAAVSPKGLFIMAETAGQRLVLARPDSSVVWEQTFPATPFVWSLGAEGRMVAVAGGDRRVAVYRTMAEAARPARPEPALAPPPVAEVAPPEEEPAEMPEWPDFIEVEEALDERRALPKGPAKEREAPQAPAGPKPAVPSAPVKSRPSGVARVAWKKGLPEGANVAHGAGMRLGRDGTYLVLLLGEGKAIGLDATGALLFSEAIEPPASLAPCSTGRAVGAWNARELLLLPPGAATARRVQLSGGPARFLDGSSDMGFYCTVGEDGVLAGYRDGEEPLWRKEVPGGASALLVSPGGATVLVRDGEGRFRYYDSEGRLARKFRFAGGQEYRALLLADDFTLFGAPDGGLAFVDGEGQQIWSRRLYPEVLRVELLEDCVAVYGPQGAATAVDPRRDAVWEVMPPPGLVCLRKPPGLDALLVHASESAVTVFSGHRRKLDVVWRYECKGEVVALDSDSHTRVVNAVAEGRVYRLQPNNAKP
jgi:hypothetical protein